MTIKICVHYSCNNRHLFFFKFFLHFENCTFATRVELCLIYYVYKYNVFLQKVTVVFNNCSLSKKKEEEKKGHEMWGHKHELFFPEWHTLFLRGGMECLYLSVRTVLQIPHETQSQVVKPIWRKRKWKQQCDKKKKWRGQCSLCILLIACTWREVTEFKKKKKKSNPSCEKQPTSKEGQGFVLGMI